MCLRRRSHDDPRAGREPSQQRVARWAADHFLDGQADRSGRLASLDSIQPLGNGSDVAVDRGQTVQPMTVLLWLLADGDIRHVAALGQICKFGPGSARFAILDQRRFKRSAVSGLLKNPIQYAAAKLGREEVSQSRLDGDINFETAIF